MAKRGAEFSDVSPKLASGLIVPTHTLEGNAFGEGEWIDLARVQQVTPDNSFRLGQQIFFYLGVGAPKQGGGGGQNGGQQGPGSYVSRVILKPWWLRPNIEYRAPGYGGWLPIDRQNFGDGPDASDPLRDNRYCWIPSPKRLDTTEQDAAPLTAPARHSYSIFEDDLWVIDLPNLSGFDYEDQFGENQRPMRFVAFMYPAMGYALGFTYSVEYSDGGGQEIPSIPIHLTWHVGTLGGSVYQESIG